MGGEVGAFPSGIQGPKKETMLRIGRRGDTSPLGGLAYANAAFAYANVFARNWLQRKIAVFAFRRVPAR